MVIALALNAPVCSVLGSMAFLHFWLYPDFSWWLGEWTATWTNSILPWWYRSHPSWIPAGEVGMFSFLQVPLFFIYRIYIAWYLKSVQGANVLSCRSCMYFSMAVRIMAALDSFRRVERISNSAYIPLVNRTWNNLSNGSMRVLECGVSSVVVIFGNSLFW